MVSFDGEEQLSGLWGQQLNLYNKKQRSPHGQNTSSGALIWILTGAVVSYTFIDFLARATFYKLFIDSIILKDSSVALQHKKFQISVGILQS